MIQDFFIEALNGAPGIASARFAGNSAAILDNRQKVLRLLQDIQIRKHILKQQRFISS